MLSSFSMSAFPGNKCFLSDFSSTDHHIYPVSYISLLYPSFMYHFVYQFAHICFFLSQNKCMVEYLS